MEHRLIWSIALGVALWLIPVAAEAQFFPCPNFVAGWSQPYTGSPITSVMYDPTSQLLYVIFNNTFASAYSNVPMSIIQTFSNSKNPVQTYNSYVVPRYHALLLQEKNNCPLLFENGAYIWSN